jgi:hypothetical protein
LGKTALSKVKRNSNTAQCLARPIPHAIASKASTYQAQTRRYAFVGCNDGGLDFLRGHASGAAASSDDLIAQYGERRP